MVIHTTFKYELSRLQLRALKIIQNDLQEHYNTEIPLASFVDFALEEGFRLYTMQDRDEYLDMVTSYLRDAKKGETAADAIKEREDDLPF